MSLDLSEGLHKQDTVVQGINCLKVDLLSLDCHKEAAFCLMLLWCLMQKKIVWNSCLLSFKNLEVVLLQI